MFSLLQHHKKKIIFILFLSFLTYVLFAFGKETQNVWHVLQASWDKITWSFLLLLLGLSLVNYILRGIRWHLLGKTFTPRYKLTSALWDYFCGFVFTVTPAKAGELIRTHYLKERFDISYTAALIPSLFDRMNDILVLFLFTLIGSLFYAFNYLTIFILCISGSIFILFFFAPTQFIPIVKWICKILNKRYLKLWAKVTLFCHYCDRLKSWHIRFSSFILSLIGWGAEFYALYLLCGYFDLNISFIEASFIFSSATIAGSLMMTPGGTGGIETAMTGLLTFMQTPLPLALFITILIRFTTLWFSVLIGILCLGIRAGKKHLKMIINDRLNPIFTIIL